MLASRTHRRRRHVVQHLPGAVGVAAIAAFTGCASLDKPDWLEPGPARYQQRKAVRFDPYLQNDINASTLRLPLMDGARPRDFLEPPPEVRRSRWWSPVQ